MSVIRRQPPERITELARGIVIGTYLVADLNDRSWQISLGLMAGALSKMTNLGAVLVPSGGPHARMHWLNRTAPGCTVECIPVAKGDLRALEAERSRMWAALWPEGDG